MASTLTESALPSQEDAELAKAASQALARAGGMHLGLQVAAAGREVTTVDLPPVVARLLMEILKETAAGHRADARSLSGRNHHPASRRPVKCLAALSHRHDR